MIAEATKVCKGTRGCGRELPLSAFSKDASRKDGVAPYCKECKSAINRECWARNPRERTVDHRRSKYGLTTEEVEQFLAVPVCQSCGLPFDSSHSQKFDHCHELGHVRGVICHACNMACAGTSEAAMSRLQLCVEYLHRDIEREQTRTS